MTPDEGRREGGADAGPPRRTKAGPRHAAPRKPLLTRLHLPAGKAIALAAMPSAVLMGMGITPQLAGAKPLPKNPFQNGPCVSVPDRQPQEEAEKGTRESAEPEAAPSAGPDAPAPEEPGKGSGTGSGGEDSGTGGEDSGSGTGGQDSGSGTGSGTGTGTGEQGTDPSGTPEPEPSPSETGRERNLLDPLGLGSAVRDLLTPDEEEERAGEAAASPPASPSARPGPSPDGDGGSGDPVEDAADKVREGVEDTAGNTAGKVREGVAETAEKAGGRPGGEDEAGTEEGAGTEDEAQDGAGTEEGAGTGEDDPSGKEPFPCPTRDAEALANAEEERTEATLPNAPWRLESTLLALHGLDYQGIVKVRTYDGTVKNVLKFTASEIDIRDLHQIVDGPGGTAAHVEAARGSTSTFRNGTVTMYTEELKGKLFGIIPITFSPDSPPPVNIPEVFFTEVSVVQAGQFGGELHIPGMHLYNEG